MHNLLFVYSPSFNASARASADAAGHMMARYPGDSYVDVIGIDSYHANAGQMQDTVRCGLPIVVKEAERRRKIPAYTEGGIRGGLAAAWNQLSAICFIGALSGCTPSGAGAIALKGIFKQPAISSSLPYPRMKPMF